MQANVNTAVEAATQKYLAFQVGNETYGLTLLQVQEIRSYTPATRIPNAPPYILGVINLRGAIIAVIDLRARLGLPPLDNSDSTIVVVVNINGKTYGLRGDAVSDVIEIQLDQIQTPPVTSLDENEKFISGLADVSNRVIMLLDPEKVIDVDLVNRIAA
jgi:purine-binding chemotaxis protein CheW